MGKTIRVEGSDAFVQDLQKIRKRLGAPTLSEAIRRLVAQERLIQEALETHEQVILTGFTPGGGSVRVVRT